MSTTPTFLSPPACPSSHLQQARQVLVSQLPPEHDLRKRIQPNGHGELLPQQPAGRPRAPMKMLPARKRGRDHRDPTMLLQRRLLMTMWNERYHHPEWDRVRNKMSQHRKRLGMRERSHKEGGGCGAKRQDSADKSCKKVRERTARRCAKRQSSDGGTLATGHERSTNAPNSQKEPLSEPRPEEKKESPTQPGYRRGRKISQKSEQSVKSSDHSRQKPTIENSQGHITSWESKEDWELSNSSLTTPNGTTESADAPLAATDAEPNPSFPTVTEILKAIPASGVSMRRITERFWNRVSCDMDKFYFILHDNAGIHVENSLIRRREAAFEFEPSSTLAADYDSPDNQEWPSSTMTIDDSHTTSAEACAGDGAVVGTSVPRISVRSLGRRGGLDSILGRQATTTTRTKCRRHADRVQL